MCAPDPAAGVLRLETGESLPIVSRLLWRGELTVTYLTRVNGRSLVDLCSEARLAFHALESETARTDTERVDLWPTDPRLEVRQWTWSGPVVSCCSGMSFTFKRDAHGGWDMTNGCGCAN